MVQQTTAPERAFRTYDRGEVRDEILASFRLHLRKLTNPATAAPFTEDEIATATAKKSRFWIEADAIDLALLSNQGRALYLADQIRPDRAAHAFLENYHAILWGEDFLPASGGSGPVSAPATVGTIFKGSTTVPDPAAVYGTTAAGLRFQVLFTVTTPADGIAPLVVKGIDTGDQTNLPPGTEIVWANGPPGAPEPATVDTLFSGGLEAETDGQFADRLIDRIRHKPASGNWAHFRDWARKATTAVEDAYVYPAALHAGSVLVAIVQKRGTATGPLARIPSVGTLTDVRNAIVPPGSPDVPAAPHVLVVLWTAELSDLVMRLSMPAAQSSGWADLDPWPGTNGVGGPVYVSNVTSQTVFQITRPAGSKDLPSGVTAPAMMIWDIGEGRWEKLQVQSVVHSAGDVFDVVLSAPPAYTFSVADWISPDAGRRELIGETLESYFDGLGPGEVIDLTTDDRAHRAFRRVKPSEEAPQRAGSAVIGWLQDTLGAALADGSLDLITLSTPSLPTDPTDGPAMIVSGKISIYPF